MFFIVVLISLYIPSIKKIFGLIGATTANLIAFILPGCFFIKSTKQKPKKAKKINYLLFFKFMGWTLIIFGIISMIITVTS